MSKSLGISKFGGMTPDQPSFGATLLEARNCIARSQGYQKLGELLVYTNAMDNRCRGATSIRDHDDVVFSYAGDQGDSTPDSAKLYHLVDGIWTDASRAAGYSSLMTPIPPRWQFAASGRNVVATNFNTDPQVITTSGILFADLTNLFQAHYVTKVRDFMVFANIQDGVDGHTHERVRWSGFDDIFDYVVSPVTQSDFQDLKSGGGAIQGVAGGEIGIVFQERSIWRMSYVGPPVVFQFDEVDPGIGTLAPGAIVQHGVTFFLAEDGFRATSGDKSESIGSEKINRTVLKDLDFNYIGNVTSGVDVDEGVIYWAYPGAGNIDGRCNQLVIYNPVVNEWTFGDDDIEILFKGASSFTSLEGLDSIYAAVEDVPGSLDDKKWSGGTQQIGAINNLNQATLFNGPPREAFFRTGEKQIGEGRQAFISGIRPLVEGGNVSLLVGTRTSLQDDIVKSSLSVPREGMAPFRKSSRYFSAEMRVTGDFKDAIGLELFGREAGAR